MDYDLLLRHSPRDITLLCERALVHMENDDIALAVGDLLVSLFTSQHNGVTMK